MTALRLLAVVVALAGVLATTAAAKTGADATSKMCPALVGPKWSTRGLSGTKYYVELFGSRFSCPAAKTWVAKFVARTLPSQATTQALSDGPAGLPCRAHPDKNGRAFAGQCEKGTITNAVGFSWGALPG